MKYILALIASLTLSLTSVVYAAETERATFAAGCFWGTEEFFRKIPGVLETKVGYIGGAKKASCNEVSTGRTGHAEALELKFDPSKVSYEELLIFFWKMHDPTTVDRQGNDVGSHYRSAIFTHSEAQKKMANDLKAKIDASKAWKKPLVTQIKEAGTFYIAEDYHQKYLVKNPGGYDNHFLRELDFK